MIIKEVNHRTKFPQLELRTKAQNPNKKSGFTVTSKMAGQLQDTLCASVGEYPVQVLSVALPLPALAAVPMARGRPYPGSASVSLIPL